MSRGKLLVLAASSTLHPVPLIHLPQPSLRVNDGAAPHCPDTTKKLPGSSGVLPWGSSCPGVAANSPNVNTHKTNSHLQTMKVLVSQLPSFLVLKLPAHARIW